MALQYRPERFIQAALAYGSIVGEHYTNAWMQEVVPDASAVLYDNTASLEGMGPFLGLLTVSSSDAPELAVGHLVATRDAPGARLRLCFVSSCHRGARCLELGLRLLGESYVVDLATSLDMLWPATRSPHQEVLLMEPQGSDEAWVDVVLPISRIDHLSLTMPSFIHSAVLNRRLMRSGPPMRFSRFAVSRFTSSEELDMCQLGCGHEGLRDVDTSKVVGHVG